MLDIKIEPTELFDSSTNEFITIKEQTIYLEHSLVSISKWESIWHKPFLQKHNGDYKMPANELISYLKCMTINKNNVSDDVYKAISKDNFNKINTYINDPHTATIIRDNRPGQNSNKPTTSEEIYYMMFSYGIPMECQKWHINRLLTLIKLFAVKGDPGKMSRREIAQMNTALNAQRRKALHTKG